MFVVQGILAIQIHAGSAEHARLKEVPIYATVLMEVMGDTAKHTVRTK